MAPNGCVCGSRHSLWIFDTPASRDSWSALARLSKKDILFFIWGFQIYISRYFTRGWTHGETTAGASHKLRAGRLMDQFCPWTDELINIYCLHLSVLIQIRYCKKAIITTPNGQIGFIGWVLTTMLILLEVKENVSVLAAWLENDLGIGTMEWHTLGPNV